jgi:hypothetical protein
LTSKFREAESISIARDVYDANEVAKSGGSYSRGSGARS